MKLILKLLIISIQGMICQGVFAQSSRPVLQIIDAQLRTPIAEANVRIGDRVFHSNHNGIVSLPEALPWSLQVSFTGYHKRDTVILNTPSDTIRLALDRTTVVLEELEILSTGIQKIPRERSTGSFSFINSKQLDAIVSTNIQDKLEGVVSGVTLDRSNRFNTTIKVRGVSTIESDANPLIILDNFPYEDDLSTINPNNVENITILKDAAAASIWGARAGNGVIVITTKSGRYGRKTAVSLNANLTVGAKPDLFYNPMRLPSSVQMEIEEINFTNGGYQIRNQTMIPLYVELLVAKRDGLIDSEEFEIRKLAMQQRDIRNEANDFLYRPALNQQYALNISGGADKHNYYIAANYDRNLQNIIGDSYTRMSGMWQNSFRIGTSLEFNTSLRYTKVQDRANGVSLSSSAFPTYTQLRDDEGNYMALPRDFRFAYQQQAEHQGLLDWLYRPLQERDNRDNRTIRDEMQVQANLKYNIKKIIDAQLFYQYTDDREKSETRYLRESYHVRNLVNRYTQQDGTQVIPYGDILDGKGIYDTKVHTTRLQFNYGQQFEQWSVNGLIGSEMRWKDREGVPGYLIYGYDPEIRTGINKLNYDQRYSTRPTSTAVIPVASTDLSKIVDRFVSYYANAALAYADTYDLTGSVRRDASNVFGVKTNQKGIPLWSLGMGWTLSNEPYLRNSLFNLLRLRTSYGSSGNVNRSVSVYPIVSYSADQETNLKYATLRSAGNPSLRWERVNTWNVGLDFRILDSRLSGSVEYYNKAAQDLIGEDILDPSTGIVSSILPVVVNRVNYADLNTRGIDLTINADILRRSAIRWSSTWLFSMTSNRVKSYSMAQNVDANLTLSTSPPIVGESLDMIYALPWYGLDGTTGRVSMPEGINATTYRRYYDDFPVEDLLHAGVTKAPYYGGWQNQFSYGGFSLGWNIVWKAGHVFRNRSMYPGYEFLSELNYHKDYMNRWKEPGDELHTNVPSAVPYTRTTSSDSYYEGLIYKYADVLITKSDYMRLQDIRLGYEFKGKFLNKIKANRLVAQLSVRNVGLIWTANKSGIDPEYTLSDYPSPRMTSFSLQASF